jgi:hypothetical protein
MTILGNDERMVLTSNEYILLCLYQIRELERMAPIDAWTKTTTAKNARLQAEWRKQLRVAREREARGDYPAYELHYDGGCDFVMHHDKFRKELEDATGSTSESIRDAMSSRVSCRSPADDVRAEG